MIESVIYIAPKNNNVLPWWRKKKQILYFLTYTSEKKLTSFLPLGSIVSAHRRILGMASVVCVLVKICVSSISVYKLDTDKLTAPFESVHQFTFITLIAYVICELLALLQLMVLTYHRARWPKVTPTHQQ